MDFTTIKFLVFLFLVALLYRLAPNRVRAPLLVASSYFFYWTWSGRMAFLLFAATAATFFAALLIQKSSKDYVKRGILFGLVTSLVLLLVFFKSAPYFVDLFHGNLVMPIGISYYTFKLLSYVLDVSWGKFPAETKFIQFSAYVAFFPQIVAGPIQRSESFLVQLKTTHPARLHQVLLGLQRILLGYFKKFVVADNLALIANYVYGHVYSAGTPLILGFYAYPFQMYADFSGLTDIAIGSTLLLGIESPENFNAPFSAINPSDYWRRWHITLTSWLTDYVFTPLRMSTRNLGNAGLVISLVINMVLIGVWHGFRWSFVLFGLVHAFYLSIDALTARSRKNYYKKNAAADRFTTLLGPIITFHLVAVAFVFFRGSDVATIFYLLGHLTAGIGEMSPGVIALFDQSGRSIAVGIAGYLLMEIADYLRRSDQRKRYRQRFAAMGKAIGLLVYRSYLRVRLTFVGIWGPGPQPIPVCHFLTMLEPFS